MSEDKQLRVVHLILDFEPLLDKFQDVGHVIRAGDSRLARMDISVLGFLTREDTVQVNLPARHSPHEVAVLREETTSSWLSLEIEINQFHLKDERKEQGEPVVQVSDSKDKPNRFSGVRTSGLVIARIDENFEEEEEMALNRKKA